MTEKVTRIEIEFAVGVDLTHDERLALRELVSMICDRYKAEHPGRVMWPFGIGFKPTYIPITAEEEKHRGMEFDESVFYIECKEREDHNTKCTKCGLPQGDHTHCIAKPRAGNCEFSAVQ